MQSGFLVLIYQAAWHYTALNMQDRKDRAMRIRMNIIQRHNLRDAKTRWSDQLEMSNVRALRVLSARYEFSVAVGDLLLLDGNWYVTHAGLLRLAERKRCGGIQVQQVHRFCDPLLGRWVFRATVYKTPTSRGFVGYGDADPSNVSSLVHGAEMRVAETRAVNRALRKAYGIGLCSVEELGCSPRPSRPDRSNLNAPTTNGNNGHHDGQPRLRDRLCLLIRQHQLDAGLVKAYAADYCGTPTLRDASREQVEAFINDLAERAAKDRPGLICQLNSYSKSQEVAS
jgi:hypothetical protein